MKAKRLLLLILGLFGLSCQQPKTFVQAHGLIFNLEGRPYAYLGCNYWYGGLLYSDSVHKGRQRLQAELDFLQAQGVRNLRVMLSAEGDGAYPYRISPSLQASQGLYNEALLVGYDYLLVEAAKRQLKVVLVLGNNWEWSGGWGQYLEWNDYGSPPLPKTPAWDWDAYSKYIAQFYSCDPCRSHYQQWVAHVVQRINTFSHQAYSEDPTIMAWELANEPRPMRAEAVPAYIQWVKESSVFIKGLDAHHLVTIGVEGVISTLMDSTTFLAIHALPSIDYATIHLWPKTWQWYDGSSAASIADSTLAKSQQYITQHARLCQRLQKPLVLEEFGLHRDGNSFLPTSPTTNRDVYYQFVIEEGLKNKVAGFNFWGYAAYRSPQLQTDFWQAGMPYTADPPQEEQGLYGIYLSDSSTWKMMRQFTQKLR